MPTVPDKLKPHNVEAEEAVIGSLLIDPDAILRVSFLSASDFYIERNGWIFEVIKDLFNRPDTTAANLITVTDELERRKQLDDVGGTRYVTGLINCTPSAIYVEHYARIVERTATLRRLIDVAGSIARLAYRDDDELDYILGESERMVFDVCSARAAADTQDIRDIINRYYDKVEYINSHQGVVMGIPTGLGDLDTLLGGLQRTDMVILAGRPGMGKTSLALSIALNAAKNLKKRVGIFSLEMSNEQLVQRLVAAETGIDSQRLRLGKIKEDEWPVFIQATGAIAQMPIHIDDTPALSALELRAKARRLHAERGLDLLIVDYLQLMTGDRKSENRQQEITVISRSVKALARELKIPILALSQLSRACEVRHDKRPILSDLRESGSLEQDADVVIFIYRDELYNFNTEYPNIAELIVSKHRSGPTGVFSVYFKKHLAQFVDLEVHREPLEQIPEAADWVK